MDVDSWVASQPTITPNATSRASSRGRVRPFRPGTLSPSAQGLPKSPLIPYAGFGAGSTEIPPADVEAAAKAKEAVGFTYLGAGVAVDIAAAVMKKLPTPVRLLMALAGSYATVVGVKNLAEGEATRQAGLKVGVTLAKCMASNIIGGSKIPA